jgi:Ca2+-binding RTX toxin-like protein
MVGGARRRLRAVLGIGATAAALLAVLFVTPAVAAESCSYDAGTKAVTASITGGTATLKVDGGAIQFGSTPVACGAATVDNTDSISVTGSSSTTETLVIDHRGGLFAPGFTAEFNSPEIEITTNLGNATDTVTFYGTEGDDYMSAGQLGMALNADGDVDVTFSPAAFPLTMHMLAGADFFNGRGQGGAGLHFLGDIWIYGGEGSDTWLRGSDQTDYIEGGPGNDIIRGEIGVDTIFGGPGNDDIAAGDGNDSIDGGPGSDVYTGSSGDDLFLAQDDEADTSFSGGAGTDTLYYDDGVDPAPVAVEVLHGDGGPPPPPPPPPASCVYDSVAKSVSASMNAGTQATLKVVSGAIWFGSSPAACGAATTTNTDSITISSPAGSVETLTLDMSGGAFAPGATTESDTSEIEITTSLGDASDVVVVYGTTGADTIRMGQLGMGLNADTDRDVTFAPLPAQVEIVGLAGPNVLSGGGGSGTGTPFTGKVILRAGDSGDTLSGGTGADELYGGAGTDTLQGNNGADVANGAGGNDNLNGGNDNDDLTGGLGADTFTGGSGADTMRAGDDLADSSINGGPDVDTAYYDVGIDPNPLATENKIAD